MFAYSLCHLTKGLPNVCDSLPCIFSCMQGVVIAITNPDLLNFVSVACILTRYEEEVLVYEEGAFCSSS